MPPRAWGVRAVDSEAGGKLGLSCLLLPPPQPLPPQVSAFPRPARKDHVPGECGISFNCASCFTMDFRMLVRINPVKHNANRNQDP